MFLSKKNFNAMIFTEFIFPQRTLTRCFFLLLEACFSKNSPFRVVFWRQVGQPIEGLPGGARRALRRCRARAAQSPTFPYSIARTIRQGDRARDIRGLAFPYYNDETDRQGGRARAAGMPGPFCGAAKPMLGRRSAVLGALVAPPSSPRLSNQERRKSEGRASRQRADGRAFF